MLSGGRTVYHGDAKEAVSYFEKNGYTCPEQENPADFFLDIIAQDELRSLTDKGDDQIELMAEQYHRSAKRSNRKAESYCCTGGD